MEDILKNPVVIGLLLKLLAEVIRAVFKKVDESKVAERQLWLHPVSIVLAFFASGLSLAQSGHLENLDLTLLQNLVLALIGVNGAGIKTVVSLVNRVKENAKQG